MSTWEERMAARASRGPLILDRETARRVAEDAVAREAEDAAWKASAAARYAEADDVRSWLGTCDVCGQPIMLQHSYSVDGMIDVGITEDGNVYTWIWHDGPLPDCRVYMSRVYQVPQ